MRSLILSLQDPLILEKTQTRQLDSLLHIKIYRNNMHLGLIKALAQIYPVCERLVGTSAFRVLAGDYVNQYPSTYVNLNDYGKHFAYFIQHYSPANNLPYLSDVAKFECLIHELLLTLPHQGLFDFQAFSALPPERYADIHFQVRSDVILFQSRFPIDKIWETNQDTFEGDPHVMLNNKQIYLLLKQQDFEFQIAHLPMLEWQLLHQIQTGCTLEQLYMNNGSIVENAEILATIGDLIQKKLITGFVCET